MPDPGRAAGRHPAGVLAWATAMLVDTHIHLDCLTGLPEALAAARDRGIGGWVVPGVEPADWPRLMATVAATPGARAAPGMHPLAAARWRPELAETLRQLAAHPRTVAIGEIGLDFFVPDFDRERQEFYFSEQLKIAREFDLPVLLHIRRAQDTVLKFLRLARVKGGIAHAFNGSRQQADEFIKLGFKLGFGGAMTFSGSTRIRALAAELPPETVVLETDAPDIPPAWLGGGRNAPGELPRIADVLAELRGVSRAEVAAASTATARAVLPGI